MEIIALSIMEFPTLVEKVRVVEKLKAKMKV